MAISLPTGSAYAASDSASDDSALATYSHTDTTEQRSASGFAAQFAPFTAPVGTDTAAPGAVDLSTFEPPVEAEEAGRSLGMGTVSFYGRQFHGRSTASGERFDMNAMTAAHKRLPFGTKVRVTNTGNGKSVIVRINDRGPFTRGRTIDLSKVAASRIGLIQRGHGTVKLELL